ncbi:MAG: leucine-rich repeat domain-containing protein, partial [Oscillospiraceae bacterium]|nr:leucine-rich repeat domain-containing protein [Oscillospiraceae bacterium]
CTALTAITIPKSVTTIKRGAFNNTALASITLESETPPTLEIDQYGGDWFAGTPIASGTGKIYVPCGSANAYKTAANWSDYASRIEALPHTPVTDPAVAATCTTAGKTAGSHCSVCNTVITAQTTVAAKGHSTTKTAAKAATCTADGNKEYWYCSTCKKYFSNSSCTTETTLAATIISKTGHSYSTDWSTSTTNHWHVCENGCGTKSANAAHSFEQKSDGTNHWQECSVCGYTKDTKTHTFTQNHDNTNHWQQCTGCGYTKDTATHSLTEYSNDTCRWQECDCGYIAGTTYHNFTLTYDNTNHWYECDTCHYKKSETEHTLTAKKDESTHWQECTTCGYKEGETAHEWGDWSLTVEPTVNTTGTAERTCSCGEKQTKTDVPVLTDDTVWTKDETTKPTISENGSYTYTSEYGEVTAEVPELKDTGVWTKTETTNPTVSENGSYTYTSDYGTVTVTVPKLTDPSWTKEETKKPAIDTDGEYTYESDYGTVTVDVPKLSDTEVWTRDTENSTEPTEEKPGNYVYTSEYGTVTVTIPPIGHTHDLTHVPEVTATETTTGTKEHWHCDGCGKDFADENGETEITADELKIGKIKKEVQSGANAPTVTLTTPNGELANAVLTDDEKELIKDGKDIKIVLKIDVQDEPAAEDKIAVETAIDGLTGYDLGMYLDVNLFKVINGEENPITETKAALTITFEVPAALRGS